MTRSEFLTRISSALGRQPGQVTEEPPLPLWCPPEDDRQELIRRFITEHERVGGKVYLVPDWAAAKAVVVRLLSEAGASCYARTREELLDPVLEGLALPEAATAAEAEVGVSGAAFGLAETGTAVLSSDFGRLATLLPMTHVILLPASRLVAGLSEVLKTGALPSAWMLATGPSRSADIEGALVTGVHGPGRVFVVLVESP
ncbi:MAG: lactate utilization protein [Truepera sp.]|nr:lactate utilization protein [Truepera sp.]